jgi:endonuclease-3 related protein
MLDSAVTFPTTAARRLRSLHDRLFATYGRQHWWPAQSSFEMILGAYLTQNTAWKSVEHSLKNLRMLSALSVDGMRALSLDTLREAIRPSGFQTRKGPALKAFVTMLDEEFDGSLERLSMQPSTSLRDRLLQLPGVGPETADAILLYGLGHAVPMADEYLRRIVERHRLLDPVPGKNRNGYDALVTLTRQAFASDPLQQQAQLFNEFHALTVTVGKTHCGRTARCEDCPLAFDKAGNRE